MRGVSGRPGEGPADPGGVRMIREKVWMIRAGQTARDFLSGTNFWAEFGDFGVKIDEISWMESGENWGKARSTSNKANPWIKINKTSSNQQITKKIGGYFWWGLSDLGRKQQNQARKHGVGAPKRDQPGS